MLCNVTQRNSNWKTDNVICEHDNVNNYSFLIAVFNGEGGETMIMPTRPEPKPVPFDGKEFTDALFGINSEENYGAFVRSRDIRRKAFDWELDNDIHGEPKDCNSFDNLRRIDIDL